jgi:hypothetical protein
MTLAEAREWRNSMKPLIRQGVDPRVQKRQQEQRLQTQKSFRFVAEQWLEQRMHLRTVR